MQIADLKTRRQESEVRIQNLDFRVQVSASVAIFPDT
jgi:hypothetical protein